MPAAVTVAVTLLRLATRDCFLCQPRQGVEFAQNCDDWFRLAEFRDEGRRHPGNASLQPKTG
jgi:hypothetical protein